MASVAHESAPSPAAGAPVASGDDPPRVAPRVLGLDTDSWPIERLVPLLAGAVTLLTLLLGRTHDRRWRVMTGLIAANLVAQGAIGWCPGSLMFRWLGFRRAVDRPAP